MENVAVSDNPPLTTIEVRWFFEGTAEQRAVLLDWFNDARLDKNCALPARLTWNERTDTYLVLPNHDDMGIKLREGQLQIKGRISSLGSQLFCGRHRGAIERWVKWSYAGLPAPYMALFDPEATSDVVAVPVRKRRLRRKVRLDRHTGAFEEVGPSTIVDSGLGFEFTRVEAAGKTFCSAGFEAFPDDSFVESAFIAAVASYIDQLQDMELSAHDSYSYPAFLNRLARSQHNHERGQEFNIEN